MARERYDYRMRFRKFCVPGENGCIVWNGSKNEYGYGWFGYEGDVVKAHRMAWEIANGSIPEGMHVLHRCDNPSCVNVSHLFLGTQQDNMRDMTQKGRDNHKVKLSDEQIKEIRNLYYYHNDYTQRELAEMYGVDQSLISYIVNHERRKRVK